MRLFENPEKLLEATKAIYKFLREKYPEYKEILSDERAEEIVNDPEKIELYKKGVKLSEVLVQGKKNTDSIKKDMKDVKIPSSLRRYVNEVGAIGTDEQSVEFNKQLIIDCASEKTALNRIKESFSRLLKEDPIFSSKDRMDMLKKYESDPQLQNFGFVSHHVLNELTEYKLTPVMKQFFKLNQSLFQSNSVYKQNVLSCANIYSIILPPELNLENMMNIPSSIGEVVKPFIDEGFEDFKMVGNVETSFQMLISADMALVYDMDNQMTFREYLEAHNINSLEQFLLNNYFVNEKGERVKADEAITILTEKNGEGLTLKEYTQEEKDQIKEGLKNPYYNYNLTENKEERYEFMKQVAANIVEANPKLKGYFKDEDMLAQVNDENEVQLHIKAKEIMASNDAMDKKITAIQEKYKIELDPSIARNAYMFMNTANTKEAEKENEAFILKISTREGAREFVNDQFQKLANINVKDYVPKDQSDYINNYDKYKKTLGSAFVINSVLGNGKFNISKEYSQFIDMNNALIEQFGQFDILTQSIASPLYLVTPKFDPRKVDVPEITIGLQKTITDNPNKFKDIPQDKPVDITNAVTLFTPIYHNSCSTEIYLNDLVDKIDNGLLKDNIFMSNYVTDKDNKIVPIMNILKNPKNEQYKIHEYNAEQKKHVADLVNNSPIKEKTVEFLQNLRNKKEPLNQLMDTILNAKAKISFFNSGEYNRLVTSINELKEVMANPVYEDPTKLVDSQRASLSKELKDALVDVYDKAKAYVDKKQNQSKNETRQTRYEASRFLMDLINKDELIEDFDALKKTIIPSGDILDEKQMEPGVSYPVGNQLVNDVNVEQKIDDEPEKEELKEKNLEVNNKEVKVEEEFIVNK